MLRSCAEGARATHRAARSVEGCENAVACAFHEISAVLLDRQFRQTIMTIEQFAFERAVAQLEGWILGVPGLIRAEKRRADSVTS